MKNQILNLLKGLVVLIATTAIVGSFFSCEKKESKNSVLEMASKFNPSFAEDVISANTVRGFADDNKGQKDSLVLIANALKTFEYDEVISLSNEYFNRYEIDENVKFMLATALFQKGEYGKAAKHYLPLLNSSNFADKRQAKYYLALCQMRFDSKQGTEMAIKYLKELKSDPGEEFNPDHIQGLIDVCS